jgi:hypothetical protein
VVDQQRACLNKHCYWPTFLPGMSPALAHRVVSRHRKVLVAIGSEADIVGFGALIDSDTLDPGCVKTRKIETRRELHSSIRS